VNPCTLAKEKKYYSKAKRVVNDYFDEILSDVFIDEHRIGKTRPAKKTQVKGLQIAFQQGGKNEIFELASNQISKSTVQSKPELKYFWETLENKVKKNLENLDDASSCAFVESFCCHYYYKLKELEMSGKIK